MGKNYTVVVSEINDSGDEVTVIELRGPIEVLQQFAPTAVASVLGAPAEQRPATPAAPVSAVADFSDGNYGPAQPRPRKRRTKVEIEADRRKEIQAASVAEPHNVMIAELDNDGQIPLPETEPEPMAMTGPPEKAYSPFG